MVGQKCIFFNNDKLWENVRSLKIGARLLISGKLDNIDNNVEVIGKSVNYLENK